MRIGVICEGQTDFWAIKSFLGKTLEVDVTFVDLQPDMDRTQAPAGWGNLSRWFGASSPIERCRRYFGGGLFEDELDAKACDFFVVQMDTDHISDQSFRSYNKEHHGIVVTGEQGKEYEEAVRVLGKWAGLENLTEVDVRRHIMAPAIPSTESWCVAAFEWCDDDPDLLPNHELVDRFMRCLHKFEGRQPQVAPYTTIDKDILRRKKYCESIAEHCAPRVRQSSSFEMAWKAVVHHAKP